MHIRSKKFQIPPDLVVKSQAIDIAEVILSRIRRPNAVHTLCRNKTSRFEQLSTSEAHWSTTKSDGMWNFLFFLAAPERQRSSSHHLPPRALRERHRMSRRALSTRLWSSVVTCVYRTRFTVIATCGVARCGDRQGIVKLTGKP
jgi:hypothetical protein